MTQRPEPVSRRERPAKPQLSRASILKATMTLIAQRGVEAVTLRGVAEQVQTGPASLYAYFANREVLLEHALDAAYSQVRLHPLAPGEADSWGRALSATIASTVQTLQAYPGLGTVALGGIPTLPGALALAEHELMLMEAGGVNPQRAALAVDLIAQFAAATAVERRIRHHHSGSRAGGEAPASAEDVAEGGARVRAIYESADPARFPHVVASAATLTGPDEYARRSFAIEVIIAGVTQSP